MSYLKVVVVHVAFSLLATSAFPLHPNTNGREVVWANPKANEAQDKTTLNKDAAKAYKIYVDSSDLYNQEEEHSQNPMVEEMRLKLSMEYERLRAHLRQELAELRQWLSPYPAHTSAALVHMKGRLAPLTQQLQHSLSDNVQDLCRQLRLYLQGSERADVQEAADPALYREAFHWVSQTLEQVGSKLTDTLGDFQSKSLGVINQRRELSAGEEEEAVSGLWPEVSVRLKEEVGSMRLGVQSRVGALKAELTALLVADQPLKAELTANQFCQSTALQNQVFLSRIERLFLRLDEGVHGTLPSSPDSSQPSGSLQEDFSAKLSALIEDILHSVQ